MTFALVFAVSTKVTPALVRDLNVNCGQSSPVINVFAIARQDPEHQKRPDRSEPEDSIDYFEECSDEQLITLLKERRNKGDNWRWISDSFLVVLDDRSVADRTVQLHYHVVEFSKEEDDVIDSGWIIWRIRVDETWKTMAQLTVTGEAWHVTFSHFQRFTGTNGVFNVKEALRKTVGV